MNTICEIIVWISNNILLSLLWYTVFSVLAGLVCSVLVMVKHEDGRWGGIKEDSLILKIFYGVNLFMLWCDFNITVPDNSCRLIRTFILSFLLSPLIIFFHLMMFLVHGLVVGLIGMIFVMGRVPKTAKIPIAWKKEDYFSLPFYLSPAFLFFLSSFYWGWEFWRKIIQGMSAGLTGGDEAFRAIFAFLTYFVGTVLFLVLIYLVYKFFPREKTKTVVESLKNKYCIKFISLKE
ncbi:MAG: hypothetical protein V1867_01365 [Candidatus Falkowbacteria bacterium]